MNCHLHVRLYPIVLITLYLGAFCFGMSGFVKADEGANAASEGTKPVFLSESGLISDPALMMKNYLLAAIDMAGATRRERYEQIETTDDIVKWQTERKEFFRRQLGTFWEKTDLNARVVGTLDKGVYRVEKIVFESQPGFYVTATAFLPDAAKYQGPWPGILIVCGHSDNGKGELDYQRVAALGASNGIFCLLMDPIEQGERIQFIDEQGHSDSIGVPAHNLIGSSSIPLGRNTATFEVWDMVRALDYLDSRSDVISGQYGVCGSSGGGTQTSYIMALDDRVAAAAPSCYICGIYGNLTHVLGPQDAEQCIFGQAGFGMDHADYLIMRAPRPTLLCTVTQDFFNIDDAWDSFRQAKRIYSRFHLAENVDLIESDSTHHWTPNAREATIRWMLRFLANRYELVAEPEDLPVMSDDEIRSLPIPGVIAREGYRSTFDLNRDLARSFKQTRDEQWRTRTREEAALLVRQAAGIRPLNELTEVTAVTVGNEANHLVLTTEPGIYLPLEWNREGDQEIKSGETLTLYIDDQGHRQESARAILADTSRITCVVDLRGWGESQGTGSSYYKYEYFGQEGTEFYLAYLLGKTYVGMRTEDLLAVTNYLKKQYGVKVRLEAAGYARTVALHAAIVEPEMFSEVVLKDEEHLTTWTEFIENAPAFIPLTDLVHGALVQYDLDNLLDSLRKPE